MNLRPLVVGIACLLCSQPGWSASLRPLAARVPPLPASAALGSVDFAATQSVAAILDLRTRLYIESGRRTSGFAQERVFLQQAKLAPSESEWLNGL